MSILICCNKTATDKYASAKSIGQFTLAASLIADDVKDLYDTLQSGEVNLEYFWILIVVIGTSLVLQLFTVVFALVLLCRRYSERTKGHHKNDAEEPENDSTPERTPKPALSLRIMNDALSVLTILVAMLHVVKNTFKGDSSVYSALFNS